MEYLWYKKSKTTFKVEKFLLFFYKIGSDLENFKRWSDNVIVEAVKEVFKKMQTKHLLPLFLFIFVFLIVIAFSATLGFQFKKPFTSYHIQYKYRDKQV